MNQWKGKRQKQDGQDSPFAIVARDFFRRNHLGKCPDNSISRTF